MRWTKARVIVGCCRHIFVKFFEECSEVIAVFWIFVEVYKFVIKFILRNSSISCDVIKSNSFWVHFSIYFLKICLLSCELTVSWYTHYFLYYLLTRVPFYSQVSTFIWWVRGENEEWLFFVILRFIAYKLYYSASPEIQILIL